MNRASAWLLPNGGDELLRFATFEQGESALPLVDHAGNGYVVAREKLQAVVVDSH